MATALNYDRREKVAQSHSGDHALRGKQAGVFHGQGGRRDSAKKDLSAYLRRLEAPLRPFLQGATAPLILAGVEYELAIYRKLCSYPFLVADEIHGSPDHLSASQLHDLACPLALKYFDLFRCQAVQRFHRGAGSDLVSRDIERIVSASREGRIDTLLLVQGAQAWGAIAVASGEVEAHEDRDRGDEDLLNYAAVQTLLHGGSVYVVRPDQLPEETCAAAVLRY